MLSWSYRGHPVEVRDSPRGRALLHALYVLEADMLGDKTSAERLHLVVEAVQTAPSRSNRQRVEHAAR